MSDQIHLTPDEQAAAFDRTASRTRMHADFDKTHALLTEAAVAVLTALDDRMKNEVRESVWSLSWPWLEVHCLCRDLEVGAALLEGWREDYPVQEAADA